MEHAVRPALAKLVRYHEERDPLPAAASAEYEWQREAKKVLKVADDLIVDFDDLQIRLSQHVAITEKIGALLKVARSMNDKNLRSAVLTVQDALYSVFSENMTLEQAESIRQVLEQLQEINWDRKRVRELDKSLRNAGFETVPSDSFVSSYNASTNA